MNRRTLVPILFVLALISLIYAVYRSTASMITTTENGKMVVYGQPQQGLMLGLCLFAGLCMIGIALLLWGSPEWPTDHRQSTAPKKATTTTTATNYPQ